jgi:hypothetical protein
MMVDGVGAVGMGQGSKVPLPISFAARAAAVNQIVRGCHVWPAAANREQRARESKAAWMELEGAFGRDPNAG